MHYFIIPAHAFVQFYELLGEEYIVPYGIGWDISLYKYCLYQLLLEDIFTAFAKPTIPDIFSVPDLKLSS